MSNHIKLVLFATTGVSVDFENTTKHTFLSRVIITRVRVFDQARHMTLLKRQICEEVFDNPVTESEKEKADGFMMLHDA
jgi:oligoendopeptidase F